MEYLSAILTEQSPYPQSQATIIDKPARPLISPETSRMMDHNLMP